MRITWECSLVSWKQNVCEDVSIQRTFVFSKNLSEKCIETMQTYLENTKKKVCLFS